MAASTGAEATEGIQAKGEARDETRSQRPEPEVDKLKRYEGRVHVHIYVVIYRDYSGNLSLYRDKYVHR